MANEGADLVLLSTARHHTDIPEKIKRSVRCIHSVESRHVVPRPLSDRRGHSAEDLSAIGANHRL